MNQVTVCSPTRVDLAGGTLDVAKLYLLFPSAVTVNFAIDVFTHVSLKRRADRQVHIESPDLKLSRDWNSVNELLDDPQSNLALFREVLHFFKPVFGFDLTSQSDSPIGGGLGGSSSLCVSLIKAFLQLQGPTLNTNGLVELASNIEARVLRKPTGTQDYFPAIQGGINIITYGLQGPMARVLEIDETYFNSRFFLVYTGEAHHSGLNNWEIYKNCLEGESRTLGIMEDIRLIAAKMSEAVQAKRYTEFGELFDQELECRRRLATGYVIPAIEELVALARTRNANVKVCGAGGGGSVMVWCSPEQKDGLQQTCAQKGFKVLTAKVVPSLSTSHSEWM